MLRKVLPRGFKTHLRSEFRRLLTADLADGLRTQLPGLVPELLRAGVTELANQAVEGRLPQQVAQVLKTLLPELLPCPDGYYPHPASSACTVVPTRPEPCPRDPALGLPIPPIDLWAGYGSKPEHYLDSGRDDVRAMRDIARRGGVPLESAGRILEWGCSAGRMLRWLLDLTPSGEVWGADVTATHIRWCKQHLSPPFHFLTSTVQPHLPFEDRYFGFLFAGSVFTHIDDLADAWFQELRRVLRPGGALYITIHDRHTVAILRREHWHWLSDFVRTLPEYEDASRSDFGTLTLNGPDWSSVFVFHDAAYLCRRLEPFFNILSVDQQAYGYQTGLLLQRR